MGMPNIDVLAMTPKERLDLMTRIWESFTRDPDSLPLPDAQRRELDRRVRAFEQGNMPTIPWDEAQKQLRRGKTDDR